MNETCFYDQTPFTIGREESIAALYKLHKENLTHYDARCPRCGRVNKIPRERLEVSTPGWEDEIKNMDAAPVTPAMPAGQTMPAPSMPAPAAPMAPAPSPAPKKAAPVRRRHKPAAKKAARKAKPAKKAAKKPAKKAAKKKAARKPARKTAKARKRR